MIFTAVFAAMTRLKKINPWILVLICLIAGIGFIMLISAANGSLFPWAAKQMIRFFVGFLLLLGIASVDSRLWMLMAYPLYVLSLILLIGVELTGFIGMGAQRWIDLYVIQLQPSEIMKISLILALSRYFHGLSLPEIQQLKTLIVPILLILMPTLLVMRQPDLGTAMIFILSGSTLFFVTGVQWWKFAVVGGAVLAATPILWSLLHDYQRKRIAIFLSPESDPGNAGYHLTQSKIALGSGGFWGKGYGKGTQSHLNFLPEKQTDFIFTMFSEEFGFMGGIILIGLYVILLAYGFSVALNSRSHFDRLLAIGMTTVLFLYIFINMAMVMGMLPVVGVPLPLISYGGTAMLTLLMGLGLVFSVAAAHRS